MSAQQRDDPERFDPELSSGLLVDAEHQARYHAAAALAAGRRVLDAGCGTGYGTGLLAAAGAASVSAIDVAVEAVERTRARVPHEVDVRKADVHELPFEDGSFDLVVCFEVIEHVDEQDAALAELRRVLSDDGVLVISSPNRLVYPPGNPHHLHEYTPGELRGALEGLFGQVAVHQQHVWLASALVDAAAATAERPISAQLRLLAPLAPEGETYTIAVASVAGPPPELPVEAVLGDTFEVRWWHEQRAHDQEALGELEHDRDIRVRLQQELERDRQRNRELTDELHQLRGRLLDLESESAELADARRRLAEARDERISYERDVQRVLGEKDAEVERQQAIVRSIMHSPSWRLTRPLRAFKRVLRPGR